jgi:hypothetical protein
MKRGVMCALGACSILAGMAEAAVLIDFSDADGRTTGYVNVNRIGPEVSGPLTNLNREYNLTDADTGNDTTWDMKLATANTQRWGDSLAGANYTGAKPAALAKFADSALSDGLFLGSGIPIYLEFSNLRGSATYEFLIYAARGNNGANAMFNVTVGSGSGGTIRSVYQNKDEYVTVRAVSTKDGLITLSWSATNADNKHGSALNFISMTEVKEAVDLPAETADSAPAVVSVAETVGAPEQKSVLIGLIGVGAILTALIVKKSDG